MIEQGKLALLVYRYGQWVDSIKLKVFRWPLDKIYWFCFYCSEVFFGISIPKSAQIGSGLKIWHFGGIIIHPATIMGANCVLRQGVTLGNRRGVNDAPIIGDNVEFGAYAQVIGLVRIGNNCRIGSMAVVLHDVPDNATAVGNPAKIVIHKKIF